MEVTLAVLMAVLAFVVAAMYAVIAFGVVPRLARSEQTEPGAMRIARRGAVAFFAGCALTHLGIGSAAILSAVHGGDPAAPGGMPGMRGPLTGPALVVLAWDVAPHLAQIVGGSLFLGLVWSRLECSVVPKHVAEVLREREMQFRAAFENAPLGMALIDAADPFRGRILQMNPVLFSLLGSGRQDMPHTYRELFTPSGRDRAAAHLLRLLTVGDPTEQEYELESAGAPVWVGIRISVVRDEQDSPVLLVAQIQDITDRRRTDRLRAAQHGVMQAVSGGDSLEAGLTQVLRKVCAALGWSGGEYWRVAGDRQSIACLTAWTSPGNVGSFFTGTEGLCFQRDQGLPGRVWASGTALWITDLAHDGELFLRAAAAREAGLNAVVGLPIRSGDQSGVLLFYAEHMPPPDAELASALEAISAHVGRFVERRRAEELLLVTAAQADRARLDQVTLDEQRRRMRQAEAIGRVGSWEWEAVDGSMTWSPALFELVGVDPAESTAAEAADQCLSPAAIETLAAAYRICADSGEPFVCHYQVKRRRDGVTREFEARGERVPPAPGRPARVAGVAMDVSDLAVARKELAAQESMVQAVIRNSPSLIYVKER